MARVSFTLRKSTPEQGSALRTDLTTVYDGSGSGGVLVDIGPRVDSDSALRAEGLVTPPSILVDSPFFEARSTSYGEVDLNWSASISATIPTSPASPEPVSMILVYSPTGEPQTVGSGTVLVESSTINTYRHEGLPEGRWVYYSLFVMYANTEETYYERAASIAVLVPKNYGSNLMLWRRIPSYYQAQDQQLGSPVNESEAKIIGNVRDGDVIGPLFKYLSIVGFDIDYIRTMLDYVMISRDPLIANSQALDAISEQMGALLLAGDLGATRLRSLLDNIGFFRRSKGTLEGTQFLAQALVGAQVHIDTVDHEVTVYSQRVNYVPVPKTGSGIVSWRAAAAAEVNTPQPFSNPVGQAGYTYTNGVFTRTGGTNTHLLIRMTSTVPVKSNGTDTVMFSVHSGLGTNRIVWGRLRNTAGTANICATVEPIVVNGVPTLIMPATENLPGGDQWTPAHVEILVDMSTVGDSISFTNLLAEVNYLGDYFDGSTRRGGWLIDTQSISDYRWAGAADNSVSLYAEDYERTKQVIEQLLYEVLPITEVSKYTIVSFNAVPGV